MKVGSKIVCVKHGNFGVPQNPNPVKGEIYTLDGFDPYGYFYLKEIAWTFEDSQRIAYVPNLFRPMISIDAWLKDEQLAYIEALEILMPGVYEKELAKSFEK